jgi:peptide/nickel transport system substrate-binding protein
MSMGDDFITFHPFFEVTNSEFKPQIFEAPIRIGDNVDFEPWLAESWEQSADGLSVTLRLRKGVKFHNGREMTADDVVWSVAQARDSSLEHNLSVRFQDCTGAQKIDDYTVRINYSERSALQLDGIARLYIFPQEALPTIDTVPVGTGPFKFVEWIPADSLTLERFDDYWRKGYPYLDKIVVKPFADPEARLRNLSSGVIDLLMNVSLAAQPELAQEEGMVVGIQPPGGSFYAFIMNINAPPFDNILVRQAMNYATNRQEIAAVAFHGQADPVPVPYPPTSWVYPKDLTTYYTYDPAKAKELLAEAGYPDGFSIKMLVRDTEGPYLEQAQVYQQQLAAIGVHVELVPTEVPDYWMQLYASDFSIVSHLTGDGSIDPSGLFETAACCRPFNSFFGIQYTQEELQKPVEQRTERTEAWVVEYRDTIQQARLESDHAVRRALYHRAVEILLDQGWTVPTVWNQSGYAHWSYVKGIRVGVDGTIWLGESWLAR